METDISQFDMVKLRTEDEARACASIIAGSEPWITLRVDFDTVFRKIMEPVRETYLAVREGQVIGLVILRLDGPFPGYVQTLGVHPQWRGRGVGARLLRLAEDRIFSVSPNMFICVSSFNPRARKLYERMGFEEVGPLKDFIVPGHDEILLRKSRGPLSGWSAALPA